MLYQMRRFYKPVVVNADFDELKAAMMNFNGGGNYIERLNEANKPYSDDYDRNALNWIAVDFEVCSIKPMRLN